jgi:hypothetical protein
MKINESQLRKIIEESVNKVLKEGQQRTPIFTLNAVDLTTDEGFDDMKYTSQTYYSEEEAIEAAKEMANKYSGWDGIINISVMAGEYELPSGDVYGEHDAIYTVSNKDEETTRSAREKSGYVRHDVDNYHTPINEGGYSKLERDIDGKTLLDGAVIRRLRKMAEQIDYISSMSSDKMQDVCSDILNVFWKHKIY